MRLPMHQTMREDVTYVCIRDLKVLLHGLLGPVPQVVHGHPVRDCS